MIAIAEAISESKHGGRRQLRRTSVCSAVNPRFSNSSLLFVDRCSLTVDEGQDPAGYPGAAALSRAGRGTGFRGADAEHNCGELRSPPLNINGANTHQFVVSNPVGNVDPWGLVTNPSCPPPGGTPAQVQAWVNRLTATAGGLPDGASLLPGNMSSGAPIWTSVDPLSMFGQDLFGGGTPIHIVDPQFVAAQLGATTFKNVPANFEASLRARIRNAAKNLAPGKSTVVPFEVKHRPYNMPEPYWAGFGTVYADIKANITVSMNPSGRVTYSGDLDCHGYDVYQWGTLTRSGNPIAWAFGVATSAVGTNYATYWDWQMPFSGSW